MADQAAVKVRPSTKERLRYLAALQGKSQADILEAAVNDYATRHAQDLAAGLERARTVLAAEATGAVIRAGVALAQAASPTVRRQMAADEEGQRGRAKRVAERRNSPLKTPA